MLTSKRPYFIRCWYDWICDNQLTPYVIVNAEYPYVQVPKDYVENGRIVLNIAPEAVREFSITNQMIQFKADFDLPVGITQILLSMNAIIAIYAEENKQGIFFDDTNFLKMEADSPSQKESPQFTIVES